MGERLTKKDIEKIEAEIEDRKLNQRKQLIEEVKEARAQGDLSENFEYYAAKKAKNQNESRIRYLENMLKHATVVEDTSAEGKVSMNNTVTLYFPEDDLTETYKLVTSIRSNSLKGKISIESPVGKAIVGKSVGDECMVEVNSDVRYPVRIVSIDQTSDEEGDEIKRF